MRREGYLSGDKLWIVIAIGAVLYFGSFFDPAGIGYWLCSLGASLVVVGGMNLYLYKLDKDERLKLLRRQRDL